MQRGRARFEFHAVLLPLTDDLRLFEHHLLHGGKHYAVARGFHLVDRVDEFFRPSARTGELFEVGKQGEVVGEFKPAFAARHFEEHVVLRRNGDIHPALAGVKLHLVRRFPELLVRKIFVHQGVIFHLGHVLAHLAHDVHDLLHHVVIGSKRLHPAGQIEVDEPHPEFEQYVFHYTGYVALAHVQCIDERYGHAVLFFQRAFKRVRLLGRRIRGVEHYGKRLPCTLQFLDDALLGRFVRLARNVRERAVRGDGERNRAVLAYDFVRAERRRIGKRHLFVGPRCAHHAFSAVLLAAESSAHHVAHAVDEPHVDGKIVLKNHPHRIRRHELGLSRHDGFPVGGLRYLVDGACAHVFVFDAADHQLLHKLLDDGGFARPDRSDDADVNVPSRACGNVSIKVEFVHKLLRFGLLKHMPPFRRI